MSLQKHLNNLKLNGITVIKNVFSKKKCENYIRRSELLFLKLLKKKKVNTFSNFTQMINSPFQYDNFFFQQVYFSKIDKILTKLLDRNYVLINTALTTPIGFFLGGSASFASSQGTIAKAQGQLTGSAFYTKVGDDLPAGTKLNIHPNAWSGSVADVGKVTFVYKSGLSTGGF